MKIKASPRGLEKNQVQNFMKIRPEGAEFFHANRQTDGRTDMTKPIVNFRNFANAPKNADAHFVPHRELRVHKLEVPLSDCIL